MVDRCVVWPAALALAVAACGGGRGEAGGARVAQGPALQEGSYTGVVRVVGSTPTEQVVLQTEDRDRAIRLTGERLSELRAVAGALVRVRGEPGRGNALRVIDYRILEIGGRRPAVGVVRAIDGGVALRRAGRELRIYDPPARLLDMVGARIWVTLGPSGGVAAYGIIRQP